jgi:hypothetical protein
MEDWISLIKSWGTLCSGSPENYEMLLWLSALPKFIYVSPQLLFCKKRADFQRFFQITFQEEWHEPFTDAS